MEGTRSLVTNGELILYGIIDPQSFFDDSIRAIDVIDSIAALPNGSDLTVRINSPGGSLVEGIAIYNVLKGAGRRILVQIDAMAASAASIVAMAGDEITMAEGATLMIHDPYAVVMGTAEELRASADVVDMQREQMIGIYASRTGGDPAEIAALMAAETYMTADDAIERGFATAKDEPMQIAACALLDTKDLARLLNAPSSIRAETRPTPAAPAASAARAASRERTPRMAKSNTGGAGAESASVAEINAARDEATKLERERVSGIYAAVRAAKLDHGFAQEMITASLSIDEARAKIIDKWAEGQGAEAGSEIRGHVRAEVTGDAVDRWAEGAGKALLARAGLKGGERNEFSGYTLIELARSSLQIRNMKPAGDRMSMVGQAFTVMAAGPAYHSTSDFPSILQNVAYLSMMKGYTEVDETFDEWTGRGDLPDFRPMSRVDMGLFPALDKVEEGGEYKYGTLGDTGTTVALATYGKMFSITRQAIVNDNLGEFTRIPQRMGRAAKRTIGNLVYAILNSNPTMQDSIALFNASHANLVASGSGAAPSVATLSTARVAMLRQPDLGGVTSGVGVRPKFILVPPELQDQTVVLLNSQYDPSGTAGTLKPNSAQNFATLIADNRLSGTAWYLAADPDVIDTIEVDYLDGNDQPFMDQKDGWNVDGTEFKVRIDAGVKALHWRGLYKNAGA
jgi:ATP-dependent protease ClpP protease subunit